MSPNGPIHEAGETARSAINIFTQAPLVLALILMNVALLGILYYVLSQVYERRAKDQELIYQEQKEVQQLLLNCVPIKKE